MQIYPWKEVTYNSQLYQLLLCNEQQFHVTTYNSVSVIDQKKTRYKNNQGNSSWYCSNWFLFVCWSCVHSCYQTWAKWNVDNYYLCNIFPCFSVVLSCQTFCYPMNCSTPDLSVPHHLTKFAQVHVHCIGDAIQTSHPLILFFFCPQSFPGSGSFPVSQLFSPNGQNTGASASASVFPMSIQGWFPLRLTGLISLLSKGLSGVFYSTTVQKHQFFGDLPSLRLRYRYIYI